MPLSQMIQAIYRAAENPASWPVFLEMLAETIHASAVLFLAPDYERDDLSVGHQVRIDPVAVRESNDYWRRFDVWVKATPEGMLKEGTVYRGEQLVEQSELRRTSFYRGFLSRYDGGYMLGGSIRSFPTNAARLSCNFPMRQGPASTEDVRLVRLLTPHLQQAIRLHRRIQGRELTESVMEEFIGNLSIGFVLVRENGGILRMNREAERILQEQDGLSQRRHKLLAYWSTDEQQLRFLTEQAIATTRGRGTASGGVTAIQRPSGKSPYTVMISPIHSEGRLFETHRAAGLILISDPARRPAPQPAILKKLFGFTKAESLVAAHLMEGKDPAEIADELHLGKHTVRYHLKSLYAKACASSRAQLVQLLLRAVSSIWEKNEAASDPNGEV